MDAESATVWVCVAAVCVNVYFSGISRLVLIQEFFNGALELIYLIFMSYLHYMEAENWVFACLVQSGKLGDKRLWQGVSARAMKTCRQCVIVKTTEQ